MIALSAAEIAVIVGGTVTDAEGANRSAPARPPPSSPGRS